MIQWVSNFSWTCYVLLRFYAILEILFIFVPFEIYWLLRCLMPLSTVFQLHCGGQCTYPCFPGVLLNSTMHIILSKPLAAFPCNHYWNNGQRWERNESCRNKFHQSSERILAEPGIEPATSCSQICNTTDWGMGLGLETRTVDCCFDDGHVGKQPVARKEYS